MSSVALEKPMRIFLSCPLPEDITGYIQTLYPLLPKAVYTFPRQHDLTIKFLGNIDDSLLPEVIDRLSEVQFPPFEAHLSVLGVFSEHLIRVVWAGIEPIEEALSPLFPADGRFLPHITVARVKAVGNRTAFLAQLTKVPIMKVRFSVSYLTLIKSVQSSMGAVHTPIARFPSTLL
jgi:2'-5' RNA ligase